jgi:TRAP-type transport system small permease protein
MWRHETWLKRYEAVEQGILAALLFSVFVLLLLQILARFLGTAALVWSEEASRYLYIWLVFLGAGVAVRRGAHIKADILMPTQPRVVGTLWLVLIELVIVAAAVMLLWHGYQLVQVSANTRMVVLGWSMSYLYLAVPAGSLLIIFFTLLRIANMLRDLHRRLASET